MNQPANPESPRTLLHTALLTAGRRLTRQRAAVYSGLLALDHPTVEEVFRRVRGEFPAVSRATIYNALDTLVASGLVAKIMTHDGSSRYDARADNHYHLRCLKSGALVDLDTRFDPDLVTKLDPHLADDLSRRGFQMTGYRLEVVGYFAADDAT